MSTHQEIFELIKKHLEFKDNWGNNPYMPKEKADALLTELQSIVGKIYEQGKAHGAKEAMVKLIEDFKDCTQNRKDEFKFGAGEWESIRSYYNWEKNE